jgi:hypothetical protein
VSKKRNDFIGGKFEKKSSNGNRESNRGRGIRGHVGGSDRGRGDFNRGRGDFSRGRGDFHKGRNEWPFKGRSDKNSARGDFNRGRGDFNRGRGDYNRGRGDYNRGRGDFNTGERGDFNRGSGGSDRGRGGSDRGRGNYQNSTEEKIHPSWAAKRNQQQKIAISTAIGTVPNKKIKFDDFGSNNVESSQKQSKSAETRHESSFSEPAEKNMHPSWAAKKSSKQGIQHFQGKKVVFGDDE